MPKQKTLKEAYQDCKAKGFFKDQERISKDKIQTMTQFSDTLVEVAQDIKKNLDSKSPKWSIVYTMYYDALRELVDIIINLDNKKIANHQCLFTYLCTNHSELELDWNFFEKIRTKRNGIQYYGSLATYNDWKEIETQINIYIKTLKKVIKEKLKEII